MKLLNLASLIGTLMIATSAHAFLPADALMKRETDKMEKRARSAQKGDGFFEPDTCTNFSGSWAGKCMIPTEGGDAEVEATIQVIQKRCSSAEVTTALITPEQTLSSKDEFNFGAVGLNTGSAMLAHVDTRKTADWNSEATEILLNNETFVKILVPRGPEIRVAMAARVFMDAGLLKVESNSSFGKISCSYSKSR